MVQFVLEGLCVVAALKSFGARQTRAALPLRPTPL
jgi:hypothetical protein